MQHTFVTIIVPASAILPVGAGILKYKVQSKSSKIIFWYLVFASATFIAERLLGSHHINNLPLLHFYTIVEYLFVLQYFKLELPGRNSYRVIILLMFLFPVLSILDILLIQNIYQYNSYPRPLAASIIIVLCMSYFLKYVRIDQVKSWIRLPQNWIISGLLIYFCSSLLYFAFLNIIADTASLKVYFLFGDIHGTLVMLMYALFTIGFLRADNE